MLSFFEKTSGKHSRVQSIYRWFKRLIHHIGKPVFNVTDKVSIYYKEQSVFKKTLISAIKLHYIIVPFLVAALLFSGGYFWVKSNNTASMVMSLNYEESAKGLNPNSTRFNIYEVKSKDVIEQMLYYFGIPQNSENVEKVANAITISPCNLKSFSADNYYITTSFNIKLTKPSSFKEVTAKEMLTYLNKAYKDIFYSSYTENRAVLSFDINKFDESEYMTIADLLKLKAQQQSKYLDMRKKQSKTFAAKTTGETFVSLSEKINNFCNYDIERYRAYILETGLSHNKVNYVRTLDYINLMNNIDYNKNTASYNVRYDGISLYDEAMISIVMIPTIDHEDKSYYMSKTKTGMDTMAKQADSFLATAQSIAKSIEKNNDIISKINAGKNASSEINKANKMIVDMQNKLAKISNEIELVDKEYITYKTNDYITFKLDDMSLKNKIQAENIVIITALLVAIILSLLFLILKRTSRGDR